MAEQELLHSIHPSTGYLMPFALRLTRDFEEARDLTQETLFRALYYKEKFREGTNLKSWMFTIMHNIFINDYRRKVREYSIVDKFSPQQSYKFESRSLALSPDDVINEKEIVGFIYKLPEMFRSPLLMFFNGYKYREISEIIHQPIGTVKSRIHQAKKILQEMLQKKTS